VLRTVAIQEDIDLRVRGKKATGSASSPVLRTGVLDLVLPLRVRANPAVAAQATASVIAYGGTSAVQLSATQASAEYAVFRGRVRDRDFVLGATTGPTVDVAADGRTVRLRRPPHPARWEELSGFEPAGAAVRGTGGALELGVGASGAEDALLLIRASKRHQSGPLGTGSEELPSAVQLDRALAVLVRPDPARLLHLEVAMASGATTGPILVSGGQPGVFYELRREGAQQPLARPAYFHQHDDQSKQLNKGIEQLAIEVDAVLARDPPPPAGDPRTTPPLSPLLDAAPLPAGSVVTLQARRAMNGLTAPLDRRAVVDDVPAVSAAPGRVVLATSRADERYRLLRDGQQVGDAVPGTGARLELPTGTLQARTVFTVAVTRPGPTSVDVERRVDIAVDPG